MQVRDNNRTAVAFRVDRACATRGDLNTPVCLQCGVLKAQPVERRLVYGNVAMVVFFSLAGSVLLGFLATRALLFLLETAGLAIIPEVRDQLSRPVGLAGVCLNVFADAFYVGAYVLSRRWALRILSLPPVTLGLCRRCDGADRSWASVATWLAALALGGWLWVALETKSWCEAFPSTAAWAGQLYLGWTMVWFLTFVALAVHIRRGRLQRMEVTGHNVSILYLTASSSWLDVMQAHCPQAFRGLGGQPLIQPEPVKPPPAHG